MKNLFLALAAVAAIAFVGCSKDDDNNKSTGLVGTSWTYSESYPSSSLTETLQFQSGGVVIWSGQYTESGYGTEKYSDVGSYTYEASEVTIRIVQDDNYGADVYTGKVEGNTLVLYEMDGSVYGTFRKN